VISFWNVARRPRWIAALVLSLALAAGFAALGQWQLSRSIENAVVVGAPDTEDAVPLDSIAEPQTFVSEAQLGRRVTVSGELVPGDEVVLSDRNNGAASNGFWLVGHLLTDDGISLAVALGWAADRATAEAAITDSGSVSGALTGRYLPSEGPQESDFESGEHSALAVADLINIWADAGPAYGGYVVLAEPSPGLDPIVSPEPIKDVSLNLLNIFYAIEWVLFAGFAIYLWYRVVKDVVEREREEAAAPVGVTKRQ
jgi:surfeit locus 1 family protein